ncbi:DNA polymerase III subunit delta [Candidatus Peregrinibacteria bacterium]|nr:DNA polymerase III subunit delta [Candidatus Peregrinibacteria bacterium]
MSQIFLFTGENTFALREEKKRWIDEFVKKHGPENLLRLTGKEVKIRTLLDEIGVAPFLAERRLVLIDGVPVFTKEEVTRVNENIHPDVILLITDPAPDRRLSGVKEFLSVAEVKEFKNLPLKSLLLWMQSVVAAGGGSIDRDACDVLLELVGSGQDMLAEELQKLSLAAAGRSITAADVERMAMPTSEGVVWKLTDLLAAGKKSDAFLFAHRYLERGGDAYGLWAILLGMLRNLTAISMAGSGGRVDQKQLASDLQIHPFAVRSLLSYAQRAKRPALQQFLDQTVDSDIALKTGQLRATDEAPEELLALIDRFILSCPA